MIVQGVVVRGYGVAGAAGAGTIAAQMPHFRARGLDLSGFHPGTLNVDIRPKALLMSRPRETLRWVRWSAEVPPEDFSFSPCTLLAQGREHAALIYYPHPDTKRAHFHPPFVVEVLAPPIDGVAYGDRVALRVNAEEVALLDLPA